MRRGNDERVLADGVASRTEDLGFGSVDVLESLRRKRVTKCDCGLKSSVRGGLREKGAGKVNNLLRHCSPPQGSQAPRGPAVPLDCTPLTAPCCLYTGSPPAWLTGPSSVRLGPAGAQDFPLRFRRCRPDSRRPRWRRCRCRSVVSIRWQGLGRRSCPCCRARWCHGRRCLTGKGLD